MTHDIGGDEASFWARLADPSFQIRMLTEGLGYPAAELLETHTRAGKTSWTMHVTPNVKLPPAVMKVIGGSLAYTETATVDPSAGRMTLDHVTAALGKKLRLHGEITTHMDPATGVLRRSYFQVEAKVFGIRTVLEHAVEGNIRASLDATGAFLRAQLG